MRLTATAVFTSAVASVGWDAAGTGLAVDHIGFRSFGQFGANDLPPGFQPVLVSSVDPTDCSPACDTAYGSFGGGFTVDAPAGTYVLGSINLDTSAFTAFGPVDVLAFLRAGLDGVTDGELNPAPIELNGAIIEIIPEPAAGALLGLGLLALRRLALRRRARH